MREVMNVVEESSSKSMEVDQNDDEEGVIGCLPSHLSPYHRAELEAIIQRVGSGSHEEHEKLHERFKQLLEVYAEQPSLLDPLIPPTVEHLTSLVDLQSSPEDGRGLSRTSGFALVLLDTLIKIRGYKFVLKFFPHQITYLILLINALEAYNRADLAGRVPFHLLERTSLIYWLSMVCKNPFDFSRLDAPDAIGTTLSRILNVASPFLTSTTASIQFAAARLIADCLARQEASHLCQSVVDESVQYLLTEKTDRVLGRLVLLLAMLKHTPRQIMLPFTHQISTVVEPLSVNLKQNTLVRKCVCKLIQRLSLNILPPILALWRYQRGKRRLEDNFAGPVVDSAKPETRLDEEPHGEIAPDPIVEWSLGLLLPNLNDNDTTVRWSAAKGIARISERLHKELASQIVSSILASNFTDNAGYGSWHGGCLALAELSRRGLLLPELLPVAFEVVLRALFYEERMGRFAWGSCVRDAACFVIWAWARAFAPEKLEGFTQRVAEKLICCALFDREISVRRAASAAFQETVGRIGGITSGIALLSMVDYFAVGNRNRCFSSLCVEVAEHAEYRPVIVHHLIELKVTHWDETMRIMAGIALQALSTRFPSDVWGPIQESILPRLTENGPVVLHGSLLAVSHTVKGICEVTAQLVSPENAKVLNSVPSVVLPRISSLKGIGGEMVKKALAQYVSLASSSIQIDDEFFADWLTVVDTCCGDENPAIREAGGINMAAREWERGGACAILESLPNQLQLEKGLVDRLCQIIKETTPVDLKWAFARSAAIKAVSKLCSNGRTFVDCSLQSIRPALFDSLLGALDDYTEDERGDIGRFVRTSAMEAVKNLVLESPGEYSNVLVEQLICHLLQQAAERIGRVREVAAGCIKNILDGGDFNMAHSQLLNEIFAEPALFIHDSQLYRLRPLLSLEPYSQWVLKGLMIAAGGISDVTSQFALQAIHEYLNAANEEEIDGALSLIARLLRPPRAARMFVPLLRVVQTVLPRIPSVLEKPDSSRPIQDIILTCKKVLANSKLSPARARLCLNAVSPLLLCPPNSVVWKNAAATVVSGLFSAFPAVRRAAAEALIETLCTLEAVDDNLICLLADTQWQDAKPASKGQDPEWEQAAREVQHILIEMDDDDDYEGSLDDSQGPSGRGDDEAKKHARAQHNALERRRRDNIKAMYGSLEAKVSKDGEKLSRAAILKRSIDSVASKTQQLEQKKALIKGLTESIASMEAQGYAVKMPDQPPLDDVLDGIHTILVSESSGKILIKNILKEYYDSYGLDISPKMYNAGSIEQLLRKKPDLFAIEGQYVRVVSISNELANQRAEIQLQQSKKSRGGGGGGSAEEVDSRKTPEEDADNLVPMVPRLEARLRRPAITVRMDSGDRPRPLATATKQLLNTNYPPDEYEERGPRGYNYDDRGGPNYNEGFSRGDPPRFDDYHDIPPPPGLVHREADDRPYPPYDEGRPMNTTVTRTQVMRGLADYVHREGGAVPLNHLVDGFRRFDNGLHRVIFGNIEKNTVKFDYEPIIVFVEENNVKLDPGSRMMIFHSHLVFIEHIPNHLHIENDDWWRLWIDIYEYLSENGGKESWKAITRDFGFAESSLRLWTRNIIKLQFDPDLEDKGLRRSFQFASHGEGKLEIKHEHPTDPGIRDETHRYLCDYFPAELRAPRFRPPSVHGSSRSVEGLRETPPPASNVSYGFPPLGQFDFTHPILRVPEADYPMYADRQIHLDLSPPFNFSNFTITLYLTDSKQREGLSAKLKACWKPPTPAIMENLHDKDACILRETDAYYRVYLQEIRGRNQTMVKVHLVDYGYDKEVRVDRLSPLPKELTTFPATCFPCTIWPFDVLDEDSAEYYQQHITTAQAAAPFSFKLTEILGHMPDGRLIVKVRLGDRLGDLRQYLISYGVIRGKKWGE
ncbi:unnamed protein product, partial [Mesorhabditis spiculigera]